MAKNKVLRKAPPGPMISPSPPALAPWWMTFPLLLVALAVPNLVFSGLSWFDTLHLMKWVVTAVPVALCWVVAGIG